MKTFIFGVLKKMAYHYTVTQIKQQAILVYLKTLQAFRRSLLLMLFIVITLQLMIFGFLGFVVTAIWLFPTPDLETKLYLLLTFFGVLFVVPALALAIAFSNRVWIKFSGAEQLINES